MRKLIDSIILFLIWSSAIATVGVLAWILGFVFINGISAINGEFLQSLAPMVVSTLMMIGLAIGVAVPIGICSAIYLVEYANQGKIVSIIRFTTEVLSGVPSIIFGLFGLIFFVNTLGFQKAIISGAFTVGIMILPTIIRTTEESLKSVSKNYREGAFALGAGKLRTIFTVVLPSALPGIATSVILSIGRIVGETAAVYFTAGTVSRMPTDIFSPGRTLAVHMYVLANEAISFEEAYATAVVLVIIILAINITTNLIFKRGRRNV